MNKLKQCFIVTCVALLGSNTMNADCCKPATCQPVNHCEMSCFEPCEFLSGWNYNLALGYESRYIFRGGQRAEHSAWGEAGVQMPGVFGGTAGLGVWALSPTNAPDWYCASEEVDVMGYYSRNLWCDLNGELGFIYYTYPNAKSAGALRNEWELYATLSMDIFMNPYLTFNYNFDRDQHVIELGVSEGVDLFGFCNTCVGVHGRANIGWLHADEFDGKSGGQNSYMYGTLQGDLVWSIKDGVELYGGPRFSYNNDGENGPANSLGGDETEVWWGIYMSLSL